MGDHGGSAGQASLPHDVFVIGGGVNGCGIARDAAGRGFSVCLAEMGDLASATSSGSTKLIHGGLRYLEFYEFRMVRKALTEREVLWSMAPHIIHPLRFVLPHHTGLRPAWFLRLGLFIYDHLGGRRILPGTRTLDMRRDKLGEPLKPLFKTGFEYSDCWVDDARLVVLNARDAADRGARILTRTEVVSAAREDGLWRVETRCSRDGETNVHWARILINATGPWIDRFLSRTAGVDHGHHIRLVQGSHIVVPRMFDHDRCYIFQNADGRITFAIPYEGDYTLIGTTDRDYEGDPGAVSITPGEIDYLCEAANSYFVKPVTPKDVVWAYSAVRPLYDDGASKAQEITRDYILKVEGAQAPLVNVFGGKITTYRRLAEEVLSRIEGHLGRRGAPWTAKAALPGGDFPVDGRDQQAARLQGDYPFLGAERARRLVRLHGTMAWRMLGDARSPDDLGRHFGGDLYELEVRYLIDNEWAQTAEDVLWRRTKEGLRLSAGQVSALDAFMTKQG